MLNIETVTIIVPVYNVSDYLMRCVNSIINQTYRQLQIILVDDGSTDGSSDICDEFAKSDERILVIHTANAGLSAARNEGMRHVNGDYVVFVDADDYIGPSHIQNLYHALQRSDTPAFSIAVTGCEPVTGIKSSSPSAFAKKFEIERMSVAEAISVLVKFDERFAAHAWGKIYPRAFFPFLRYPVGKYYEDQYVTYKVFLKAQEIIFISTNDYFYTVDRAASISNGSRKWRLDALIAVREMLQCVRENRPEVEPSVRTRYQIALIRGVDDSFMSNELGTYVQLYREALKEKRWATDNPLLPISIKFRYRSLNFRHLREIALKLYASANDIDMLNILSKVNTRFSSYCNRRAIFDAYLKQADAYSGSVAYLIMTPRYRNYGDQLIAFSELLLLREAHVSNVVEIPFEDCQVIGPRFADMLKPGDCVFVTGGGYLGDLWTGLEKTLLKTVSRIGPQNPIVFFPQSIFYEKRDIAGSPFVNTIAERQAPVAVFTREAATYTSLSRALDDDIAIMMPDVGLFVRRSDLIADMPTRESSRALICLRKDKEGLQGYDFGLQLTAALWRTGYRISSIDTHVSDGELEPADRADALGKLAGEFGRAGIVVTNRLHGMIFSMIMGTPCVVLDNISKKVTGVAAWVEGKYPLVIADPEDIESAIRQASAYCPYDGDVVTLLEEDRKALLNFLSEVTCVG